MKLFYSPTSPFVRKVMACAIALGLDKQIEQVTTDPWASPQDLLAQNPLSQVPCLVTEDGMSLFDSRTICEYLNHLGRGALFPPDGATRWRALRQQSIADGILDNGILRRREAMRPDEAARQKAVDRYKASVMHGLDALEAEPPADHLDIGTISVVCALGWLDLRYPDEDWREDRPHLAQWFQAMQARPELARTAPG